MKFRIHFTAYNGADEHIDIEAETIEELRFIAKEEVSRLGGIDPWSEEIKP